MRQSSLLLSPNIQLRAQIICEYSSCFDVAVDVWHILMTNSIVSLLVFLQYMLHGG